MSWQTQVSWPRESFATVDRGLLQPLVETVFSLPQIGRLDSPASHEYEELSCAGVLDPKSTPQICNDL
jgi:hypothetical protein